MMSPLSVSQFLRRDMRFDVVIFDEASQVRPCDAINCIYRGDAADRRRRREAAAADLVLRQRSRRRATTMTTRTSLDFESVLDLLQGTRRCPSLPLRWHYRSRHESLITFSNHAFYDGATR